IVSLVTAGNRRSHDLDDSVRVQVRVGGLIDLPHPTSAETLDDAVLVVEQLAAVATCKIGYCFTTVRASFERGLDFPVAASTLHYARIITNERPTPGGPHMNLRWFAALAASLLPLPLRAQERAEPLFLRDAVGMKSYAAAPRLAQRAAVAPATELPAAATSV